MIAKTISPARDRLQSRILVWVVMPILCTLSAIRSVGLLLHAPRYQSLVIQSLVISVCFALFAWLLKAATPSAAACGGVICLQLIYGTHVYMASVVRSALVPLIALFVLTFIATRAGRNKKDASGLTESPSGRTTSQVVANLGFAALCAFPLSSIAVLLFWPNPNGRIDAVVTIICVSSALAEAAADTVSSEIGQAFGGTPFMLTTLRHVEPGTDGAVSLKGSLAGIGTAAIIAAAGAPTFGMTIPACIVVFAAATAGLFFDSLLGATLERRGYLGNDLVNFASTAFAAAISFPLAYVARSFLHI